MLPGSREHLLELPALQHWILKYVSYLIFLKYMYFEWLQVLQINVYLLPVILVWSVKKADFSEGDLG